MGTVRKQELVKDSEWRNCYFKLGQTCGSRILRSSWHDESPLFEGVEVAADEAGHEAGVLEASPVEVGANVDEEAALENVEN